MNKLILDCSAGMSVLLCKGDEVFFKIDENQKKHTDELLLTVDELFKNAGISVADLDVIGVCVGPGSFTGVRVAISICKGLAVGTNAKVVEVSNFDLYSQGLNNAFVVLEGFSNYVYVRKIVEGKIEDSCEDLTEFASKFKAEYSSFKVVVGNEKTQNVLKNNEILSIIGQKETILCVNSKVSKNEFVEINQILPVYLRASQAEIERNKKLGGNANG